MMMYHLPLEDAEDDAGGVVCRLLFIMMGIDPELARTRTCKSKMTPFKTAFAPAIILFYVMMMMLKRKGK